MQEFKNKVLRDKARMVYLLYNAKADGLTIAGYGAPAKATTLLHYYGIGQDIIDFIVDDSPLKERRYMPGNHIPIVNPQEIYNENPDIVLIFAWNFAESIIQRLRDGGYKGKCIVPFV